MARQLAMIAAMAGAMAATAFAARPALANGMTASASGEARAQVIVPLIVTREADLEFGAVFAGPSPGTVTVSGDGGTSYAGGAQRACVAGACYSAHPASFSVRGEAGRTYVVSVPAQLTATGTATDGSGLPATPLSVRAITVQSASRPESGPLGQLDSHGADRFQVGGTLEMPAGLPSASYRATIPVIVTYG